MNKRERAFHWAHHSHTRPGWLVDNAAEGWYPGAGFLVAHDTIEHLSDKGDWAHELRAAGVAAFVIEGVQHRDLGAVAEDVAQFAAKDHHFAAPRAPHWAHKPLAGKHEQRVQALATELREIIDRGLVKAEAAGAPVPALAKRRAPSFADKALPWFRLGYRAAMRVYGADNGYAVGRMMDAIRDAVNHDHDVNLPLKGEGLRVSVDTKRLTFNVERTGTKPFKGFERQRMAMMSDLEALLFKGY